MAPEGQKTFLRLFEIINRSVPVHDDSNGLSNLGEMAGRRPVEGHVPAGRITVDADASVPKRDLRADQFGKLGRCLPRLFHQVFRSPSERGLVLP